MQNIAEAPVQDSPPRFQVQMLPQLTPMSHSFRASCSHPPGLWLVCSVSPGSQCPRRPPAHTLGVSALRTRPLSGLGVSVAQWLACLCPLGFQLAYPAPLGFCCPDLPLLCAFLVSASHTRPLPAFGVPVAQWLACLQFLIFQLCLRNLHILTIFELVSFWLLQFPPLDPKHAAG